jgi:hypothetical protein
MNHELQPPDNGRLIELLRESRPAPALPSGFQTAVWRRIERTQASGEAVSVVAGLAGAIARLLRPRLALAGVAALLVVGTSLGILQGRNLANDIAKQQYLAAVSPPITR